MDLQKLYTGLTSKFRALTAWGEPEAVAVSTPASGADIVLCNDADNLHRDGESVARYLKKEGRDIKIKCVHDEKELLAHLATLKKDGAPPPNAFLLDVGGVGEKAALKVIKWFDKNYPGADLPAINFLSLDTSMGITEAGRLRESDGRVQAGFVGWDELRWLENYLEDKKRKLSPPVSNALRSVLNDKLNTSLPLDHDERAFADEIRRMQEVTNDRVLEAWEKGRMPDAEMLERMRDYASGLTASLRDGFYTQGGGLERDGFFYGSTGFPMKGPVAFSLEEVRAAGYEEKPVLVMQSYDPEVVPYLSERRLGGLVVTAPYMASHLKLLCETHMITGLFGLMPKGEKSLTHAFNEEARPDLPPYFTGDTVEIAGQKVKRGQKILVGLGGNGLVLNPPESMKTPPMDAYAIESDDQLRVDIKNLKKINRGFARFFEKQRVSPHGVKANIESAGNILGLVGSIGLVRTEQMVAGSRNQLGRLKKILLKEDSSAYEYFFNNEKYDYSRIIRKLDEGHPVKIRLFDFVHREIFDAEERKSFLAQHGTLDIHGGEALAVWPRLYSEQCRVIMEALKESKGMTDTPLEIMMPAVKTEKDVTDIKNMINAAAQKSGVEPKRYSFGVMIETMDSCENISAIVKHCDFISFGTNDLTQEFFDLSRDDLKAHARFAGRNGYDPFKKLAPEIQVMMQEVTAKGREANPELKVDVCGAQAADPETATDLFKSGIDNISVAPSLNNLFGLPITLNYRLYDAQKGQHKPRHAVERKMNAV